VPNAEFHAPYGMTESLLISDIDHHTQHAIATQDDRGVCVGKPLDAVRLAMAPLDFYGRPGDVILEGDEAKGKLAEIVISTDRKSTRLNSSHVSISYAVFCLKQKHTLL